tara:strand:- start:79 stop:555 length:477 start_codon:yes stop_codon:yes gene_type:complete
MTSIETMTKTTFAEYAAAAEARQDIAAKILAHSFELCEVLRANFIDYSIKQHERSIDYADAGDVNSVRYHEACIDKLNKGISDYDFTIDTGRKYHKVIMNAHGNKSVHAFIDKKTGEVYKAASWKAPAKGVRFNLLIINSREECFQRADWAGSYLYVR